MWRCLLIRLMNKREQREFDVGRMEKGPRCGSLFQPLSAGVTPGGFALGG